MGKGAFIALGPPGLLPQHFIGLTVNLAGGTITPQFSVPKRYYVIGENFRRRASHISAADRG